MAYGFEVYDASGNLTIGSSTRTGFIIGVVDITSSNQSGSVTNSTILKGTPFYYAVTPSGAPYSIPLVTFSGSTMSWSPISGASVFLGQLWYGIR